MASTTKFTQVLAGWRWRQHDNGEEWHTCAHSNPTTEIFVDLLDAKRIPDPFLDKKETLVQWVGEVTWEYECDFVHEPNANHPRQELVFGGLDTFADVFLNDTLVLESSNMFHCHRVNVTDFLKTGVNVLRIVFRSALLEGRSLEAKHGCLRAFNGEGSRLHVRKAAYHYGWDWGPILLSCGPYREIHLESYAAMVYDVFANATVAEDLQHADLDVSWSTTLDQDVDIGVTVTSPSGHKFHELTALSAHDTQGKVHFAIPQPELWAPAGHGPQIFYTVEILVCGLDGATRHTSKTTIGIRRVRLVRQPLLDEPGTSFYLEVNNKPIYCTGTNYIPDHSFLTKLTPQDYAATVENVLDGNQNMLRIWAGGVYEHEALYAECDRRGVLVWQDFMFACGQYPCYQDFSDSVKKEAADQLKRLRNYCSIVLYAGNNEDYQVIEALNLEYNPDDLSGDYTTTAFPARTIYETHLPALMSEYSPNVPYHPGSPWGGSLSDDRTVGDIHQWNVWHGTQEPYQLWDKLTGRFVSEFGMLSHSSARSTARFITDLADRHPQSAAMEHHNKAEGGVRRLALYILENLRVDSMSLESWTYASQLVQAECLAFAVRSCRRLWKGPSREYCGGQLIWQLNDCWPASSWGMIDFYGNRKLAFYSTKQASAPLALGMNRSTPELKLLTSPPPLVAGAPHDLSTKSFILDVWAVNTTLQNVGAARVELRFFDTQTGKARAKHCVLSPQDLPANKTVEVVNDHPVDGKTVVQALLLNEEGAILARASDWPQPLKHVRMPASYDIKIRVLEGRVEITSDAPVKGLELYVADEERVVVWDDNCVDVFPSDTYVVRATGLMEKDDVCIRYYGMDWIPNGPRLNGVAREWAMQSI